MNKNNFDKDAIMKNLSHIKGQDDVILDIINSLITHDTNLFPTNKPLTWMFAGASGIGKTEISKVISQNITNQDPIILNIAEFHSPESIDRIIGSPIGYLNFNSNHELPFDSLESNPYRIISLDEFEKADIAIQRLFLSIMDEGYLKTTTGNNIDFSKSIIIATTNAAKEYLPKMNASFGNDFAKNNKIFIQNLENIFDTELLARFTKIFAFNKLDKETYKIICQNIYTSKSIDIYKRLPDLSDKLPYTLDQDDLDNLVEKTYIESQGARPAKRAIENYIEQLINS